MSEVETDSKMLKRAKVCQKWVDRLIEGPVTPLIWTTSAC